MKKIILFTLLMFSIFSCFSKKTPPKNIESWLELHFPDQFEVLVSNLKMLDVMAQFKGEKLALVADKSDPDVQFLLDWQKGADSLGLIPEQVKQKQREAQIYVFKARELFKLLKDKGLENFSIGVIEQSAYIQVFLEPTPAARKQTLEIVKAVLDARPEQPQTSIFLELMEASSYQSKFKDIIPHGHWKTAIGWQNENNIMSLDFEWSKELELSELMRYWELNSLAKRGSAYQELAYNQANEWAEKYLQKPWFMPSNRPYTTETLEMDEPAIAFGFPFYDQKLPEDPSHTDPEPKGFIVGTYFFDQKVFTKLRKQAEF